MFPLRYSTNLLLAAVRPIAIGRR